MVARDPTYTTSLTYFYKVSQNVLSVRGEGKREGEEARERREEKRQSNDKPVKWRERKENNTNT